MLYSHCYDFIVYIVYQRPFYDLTQIKKLITIGCRRAATTKTLPTKQMKPVVAEHNCDSIPSTTNPIRTTTIARL